MRLTDIQTALKRYGFDDSDPLTTWINAGQRQFADAYEWPFLDAVMTPSVTANVGTVNLPTADTTFRKVQTVAIKDTTYSPPYQKLRYWEAHRFDRELTNPVQTGIPELYTLTGLNTLQVWPIPTVNVRLQIRFTRNVPDLVLGTDTPVIPPEYHFTIVRAAAVIALQAENEEERASEAQDAYEGDLQAAIQFYSSPEGDDPATVEEVQGYGD